MSPGWRSYVSRGQAPKSAGYDPTTGRQVWEDDDVQHWVENRPGQGARSTQRALERARSRSEDEG